jgi:hypothetical protein
VNQRAYGAKIVTWNFGELPELMSLQKGKQIYLAILPCKTWASIAN